jgi:hypothetical protein
MPPQQPSNRKRLASATRGRKVRVMEPKNSSFEQAFKDAVEAAGDEIGVMESIAVHYHDIHGSAQVAKGTPAAYTVTSRGLPIGSRWRWCRDADMGVIAGLYFTWIGDDTIEYDIPLDGSRRRSAGIGMVLTRATREGEVERHPAPVPGSRWQWGPSMTPILGPEPGPLRFTWSESDGSGRDRLVYDEPINGRRVHYVRAGLVLKYATPLAAVAPSVKCLPGCTPARPCLTEKVCPEWYERRVRDSQIMMSGFGAARAYNARRRALAAIGAEPMHIRASETWACDLVRARR